MAAQAQVPRLQLGPPPGQPSGTGLPWYEGQIQQSPHSPHSVPSASDPASHRSNLNSARLAPIAGKQAHAPHPPTSSPHSNGWAVQAHGEAAAGSNSPRAAEPQHGPRSTARLAAASMSGTPGDASTSGAVAAEAYHSSVPGKKPAVAAAVAAAEAAGTASGGEGGPSAHGSVRGGSVRGGRVDSGTEDDHGVSLFDADITTNLSTSQLANGDAGPDMWSPPPPVPSSSVGARGSSMPLFKVEPEAATAAARSPSPAPVVPAARGLRRSQTADHHEAEETDITRELHEAYMSVPSEIRAAQLSRAHDPDNDDGGPDMRPPRLPAGRSRRASFMNIVRSGIHSMSKNSMASKPPTEQGYEGLPPGMDLDAAMHSSDGMRSQQRGTGDGVARPLNASSRSHRASLVDFFRGTKSATEGGMDAGGADGGDIGRNITGSSKSMTALTKRNSRRTSLGPPDISRANSAVSTRSRRKSVLDILGEQSKKGFAMLHKMVNKDAPDYKEPTEGETQEMLQEMEHVWCTSLADFKPLTLRYHQGRYMAAWFACSIVTGEHHILKMYEKGKMLESEIRGVNRALGFAQQWDHPNLIKCLGTWEDADKLYIVEEYASKGDLLQDSMSHPGKYTEAFVAVQIVEPLLQVLQYLHDMGVIHRAIFPENIMFGRNDRLRLGHFIDALDQYATVPNERIEFLDYMAPEMLAVREHDAPPLLLPPPPMAAAAEDSGGGLFRRLASRAATNESLDAAEVKQQPGRRLLNFLSRKGAPPDRQSTSGLTQDGAQDQRAVSDDGGGGGGFKMLARKLTKLGLGSGANTAERDVESNDTRSEGQLTVDRQRSRGEAQLAVDRQRSRSDGQLTMEDAPMPASTTNPWEWQEKYDEKVDIWQIGCLVHELLCGSLPFETPDKLLAAALILWADVTRFPDNLSPEFRDFIKACLVKNPVDRPSATVLLQHPWIVRHMRGDEVLSVNQLRGDIPVVADAVGMSDQATKVSRCGGWLPAGWGGGWLGQFFVTKSHAGRKVAPEPNAGPVVLADPSQHGPVPGPHQSPRPWSANAAEPPVDSFTQALALASAAGPRTLGPNAASR